MVDPAWRTFFTMWGFFILLTVYIEAWPAVRGEIPHPVIGRWVRWASRTFFATCLSDHDLAIIRILRNPDRSGSRSLRITNGGKGSSC